MARRALLAGLAALALAGCGGGGGGPEPRGRMRPRAAEARRARRRRRRPTTPASDQQAAGRRARALEAEDSGGARSHRHGRRSAQPTAGRRERTEQLHIERIRYVPDDVQTDGDSATATVTMSYRVRGMSRPFQTDRAAHARGGRRRLAVAKDVPARASRCRGRSPRSAPPARAHVVLLTPPGVDPGELRPGSIGRTATSAATCRAATCPRRVLVSPPPTRDDRAAQRPARARRRRHRQRVGALPPRARAGGRARAGAAHDRRPRPLAARCRPRSASRRSCTR